MEFFRPLTPGPALLEVYRLIRAHVRPIETDRVFSKDIQSIRNLIETREMLHVVENKIGALK
jgi:histidine ammonia-lyase